MSLDLWQRGCERLAAELPEQQFNTWIRPLSGSVSVDEGTAGAGTTVVVRVPNRFKLDWIRAQYAGRIEATLSELAGTPVRLELSVAPTRSESPALPLRRSGAVSAASVAIDALGLEEPTEAATGADSRERLLQNPPRSTKRSLRMINHDVQLPQSTSETDARKRLMTIKPLLTRL